MRVLQRIQQALSPLSGIKRVQINPSTGSVLVEYPQEQRTDFERFLSQHGTKTGLFALRPPELTQADDIADKIAAEAEFLAAHSDVARVLVNFVKHLNEKIRVATDNQVDLKVLLPLGLAVYTFVEAGSEAVTPLWVTLGIFSFNSFVALHQPHPSAGTRMDSIANASAEPASEKSRATSGRLPRQQASRL
jgi:hypothetical protein